jgi:nitrite reductase/ring-hydroxylating ferredoxin subunit
MTEDTYEWHKVAADLREINFNNDNVACFEVALKKICIARYRDQYFAFSSKCPHAGGNLSEGYVDALGNIVCPVHRYKFSLKNGRDTMGEGYRMKTYPVELRENGVFVGFESFPS